ncbi:hypothetical protein B0T18DRAFT_369229 [Schizothecium vesticola]|uniref:Signal recognition particle subunit SRP68 n=1 Tax=Schizothecium vesticola TaxID=314040 RepID=A0AA40EW73_9PEZI|nr:hypothetical protein B0T18DRAFT_369229 [Schizothecium vesticola]
MDITKLVVSSREAALLYGDYSTYRRQLSGKLLKCRKKLSIATRNRGKFHPRPQVTAEQIAENHEYIRLQILTSERAWAHAMAMKASHTADTKGMSGKTRSHIVSRLQKGAKVAETLVAALSEQGVSGANATDLLEAHAYAALLRGSAEFEKQSWHECLKSYSVARIVYSALTTSVKGDIFKDLLTETIDPSIRYAAYQAKIPRTQPVPAIARKAFQHVDSEVVGQIKEQYPDVLNDQVQGPQAGAEGVPSTISWRGREVKIEDAAIAVAWGSVADAKAQLSEKLASADALLPKDMAGAYDDILAASQDAVDATKTAIDELKSEGVPQSDSRMQSLQITRTAVNFEMISWRIGRNRVLAGKDDGAHLEFGQPPKAKKGDTAPPPPPQQQRDEAPGRQIAKLKEKVVLYDGTLQSLDTVAELPGVANDQDLSSRLEATKQYFTALKCLALARSHSIAGAILPALALTQHALSATAAALPVLPTPLSSSPAPRNIHVHRPDVERLHALLTGELQRSRALYDIFSTTPTKTTATQKAPLVARLAEGGAVDLERIVEYPPRLEVVPVKPLFLDVAWNYIGYPDKAAGAKREGEIKGQQGQGGGAEQEAAKPQKRGWFGFGR